jgi:uncharacterized protein (DUF849 family)
MASRRSNKVIISCAITGAIHTPTLSEALPYKPADIAQQAVEAAEAGAAILHLHARDPGDGSPAGNPADCSVTTMFGPSWVPESIKWPSSPRPRCSAAIFG